MGSRGNIGKKHVRDVASYCQPIRRLLVSLSFLGKSNIAEVGFVPNLIPNHHPLTMRLHLHTFIAPVLSVLLYGANAEPSQAGELYPPGYLPLVNRANALLSVGQFNDAARAYTEAIGACNLPIISLCTL